MNFKEAKCPSCGGDLQVPTDRETVKCMYCGSDVLVQKAISLAGGVNIQAVSELAKVSFDAGNYEEAIKRWDRILEIDSNNAEAWFQKALILKTLGNVTWTNIIENIFYLVREFGGTDS